MTKTVWKDLSELTRVPDARREEFAPEVNDAIQQLRREHGIAEDTPASIRVNHDADRFRDEVATALPGVNRRGFLQLTGAAAVFALAGCWHKDPDTLVPYAQQPEGSVLGKPTWWSTIVRDAGRPVPVMVKTYDGRPIKIDGNPDAPGVSGARVKGACDLATQAALLNLYDPDRRTRGPLKSIGGKPTELTWDALDAEVGVLLKDAKRVVLISGPVDGLASRRVRDTVIAAYGDRLAHAAFAPFAAELAVDARKWAFGAAAAKPPVYHVDRAAVLVTLGSDFLGGGQTGIAEQVAFGDFRRLRGAGATADLGQVIAFEPTLSQTGTIADVRVRATMDQVERIAWGIAKALGAEIPAGLQSATGSELGLVAMNGMDVVEWTAKRLAAVRAEGGHSLIYVGGATHQGDNSRGLHLAANLINSLLGNEGVTVETASVPESAVWGDARATRDLLATVGADDVVILVDANPAAALPGVSAALAKAKAVICLADRADESAAANANSYLAPTLHSLESWGDAELSAGVYAIQQPIINPLWDCRAAEESLLAFTVAAFGATVLKDFRCEVQPADAKRLTVCSRTVIWQAEAHGVRSLAAIVHETWLTAVKPASGTMADDRTFWTAALARGVVNGAAPAAQVVTFNTAALSAIQPAKPVTTPFQLVISASRALGDGRSANNAWLQEIPDPVSRVTWDNYLAISPRDVAAFGISGHSYATGWANPVVELKLGATTVRLPVHVQEGQHPGTIECFLGWGRPLAGKVAEVAGPLLDGGLNAFLISGANLERWGIAVDSVTVTGDTYRLACTQGHNTMDGRDIVRDDVLDLYRKDPGKEDRGGHHPALWNTGAEGKGGEGANNLSLWGSTHVYAGRRWGMTVDLTTCTGCQACVVACSVENNVPVVGRDEVRRGREMHWIRIDRYFSSPKWHQNHPGQDKLGHALAADEISNQLLDVEATQMPVMCQQCGHAPCEEVCPAMATMHNEEGLNVQVYNRCIGTRYCSNNCPYKVRRFNFYEYSKYRSGPHDTRSPFTRIAKNLTTEMQTSSSAELSRAPLQMLLNPVVSVRSKGVMEKCNFCIQRTRDVREGEKASGKRYDDKATGAITTACAQTCPTGAIVFGDINDPESAVNAVAAAAPQRYRLLDAELNTRPSVLYLARIRNRPADSIEQPHAAVAPEAAHAAPPASHGEAH